MKRLDIYVLRLDLMVEQAMVLLYFWIYLRISYEKYICYNRYYYLSWTVASLIS
jgi:hypothetical protein